MDHAGCPTEERLTAFHRGELDEAGLEAIGEHLASCPRCEAASRRLDALLDPTLAALRRPGESPRARDPAAAITDAGAATIDGPPGDLPATVPPEGRTDAEGTSTPMPRRIAGYEVLDELGRGGMGVVYRAYQARLGRPVALKMMLGGRYADPRLRDRFRREAESIAGLRHPHIVQIFDIGEEPDEHGQPTPYMTLEYIAGGTLDDRTRGEPQRPDQAAEWVETIARAVDHAHHSGIVHRDLKPSNVLVDVDGRLKITDFGLAKRLESSDEKTRTGVVLGTPEYMAPEQAEGREAGPPVDIYALGAILYKLLTGRPPFQGASALETLQQLRHAEPIPPGRLLPRLPRDVETICLKCLEKEPARRYTSAGRLADDLRRFLDRRPVLARPTTGLERAWKWARRRPVVAGLSAAVLLLLLTIAVGSTVAAVRIARIADRETQARGELRHTLYVSRMNLASQAWDAANIERLRELLVPYRAGSGDEDLRGFEWYLWWDRVNATRIRRELAGHESDVQSLAFAPDGATLATISRDGTAKVWDVVGGPARQSFPIRSLAFQAVLAYDGRTLAAQAADGVLTLWDAETGAVKARLRTGNDEGRIRLLAFSPDRRTLVAYRDEPRQVELWDVPRSRLDRVLPLKTESPWTAAITQDGRTLAAGFTDGRVELLDITTGSPRGRLDHPDHSPIRALAFSPDGRTLAAGYQDQSIRLRDIPGSAVRPRNPAGDRVSPRDPLGSLPRPAAREKVLTGHRMPAFGLAFSPDGRTLASGSLDNTIILWDAATGRCKETLRGHGGAIYCVGFSPDGSLLASGGLDRVVKLWGVDDGARDVLDAHPGGAVAIAFLPGGKVLASGGRDHLVKLWDVDTGHQLRTLAGHQKDVCGLAVVNLQGVALASSSRDGTIRLWDPGSGSLLSTFEAGGPQTWAVSVAGSPDGRTLASGGTRGELRIRDVATGRVKTSIPGRDHEVRSLGWSPDGRVLAAGNWVDGIDLYDTATWQFMARLRDSERPEIYGPLPFSPDGSALAIGLSDGSTTIWDVARRQPRTVLRVHGGQVVAVAYSPDGRILATASRDRSIKLWDAATGELMTTLYGHTENVYAVAFSPDGTILASASLDGTVRLWRAPRVP